jgi:uncharacterized membrane protein YedE/YeeE
MEQILGLVTGLAFGFLLQKGRVLRYEKQVGAMLFTDMTIFKFMLSAIIVGMFGILLMANMGIISLSPKAMNVGGVVIGGALFGIGWAVMGFCPGTAVGAIGEGRWHAIFALIGMLLGAAIYAEIFPAVNDSILSWANFGNLRLPEVIGVNQWIVAVIFTVVCLALFRLFEKKGV